MKTEKAVEAFLRSRCSKGLSEETIKWYKTTLEPFAAQYPELPDDPETIEIFLGGCRAGDERRHGYYRALRALYRFLKRYNIENVIPLVETPKRTSKKPRPITLDALDQLLAFPHKEKVRAAIMFMADSGARIGETARLQITDLFETEWGHAAIVNGKTGERIVPIEETTYQILRNNLPLNISPNQLSKMVSAAFKEAHVKGTAHCLRHTFGTYWEGDETILQKIMGHASIHTTIKYRDLRVKRMCEQHHTFSPLKMIAANRQLGLFNTPVSGSRQQYRTNL